MRWTPPTTQGMAGFLVRHPSTFLERLPHLKEFLDVHTSASDWKRVIVFNMKLIVREPACASSDVSSNCWVTMDRILCLCRTWKAVVHLTIDPVAYHSTTSVTAYSLTKIDVLQIG
jgi:hypothetical protein